MTFATWLRQISVDAGLKGSVALEAALSKHGCHCTRMQVEEWLTGAPEPSFDKMRSIVSALQKEFSDIDVWEHYGRFILGGSATDAATATSQRPETTLDSVLRDNPRLPPGLT